MECNNQYCMWNFYDQCCPEDVEAFNKATPNELDCPSSLRRDFQKQLILLVAECESLLHRRNMKELVEIKKFIESQRM
ncbi:hypothetical protein AB1283_00995 [Bacillus sp. S13(2024)]|uniref:hypothetical protein n=1 Tax=Bacillus sp. S13(2024) TaxID=3162885 RepID=UPI003D23556C